MVDFVTRVACLEVSCPFLSNCVPWERTDILAVVVVCAECK